jgi:hypothetical protein
MAEKRERRPIETMEYLQTVLRRTIITAGRRVADADEIELKELLEMRDLFDQAIQDAVDGQRTGPAKRSWAGIAAAAGVTRSAAFQKWGSKK